MDSLDWGLLDVPVSSPVSSQESAGVYTVDTPDGAQIIVDFSDEDDVAVSETESGGSATQKKDVAPPPAKRMRSEAEEAPIHEEDVAARPVSERVILNDVEKFGCDRWREHFRARGLFDPQAPQGSDAWLAERKFFSGSTFYELMTIPIHDLVARYVYYTEHGGHPRIFDRDEEPRTVLNQHLARGHAGEDLVVRVLQELLADVFPEARVFFLECPSMPVPGMDLVSDSPDGAVVICRCASGGECVASAVEIKFPVHKPDVVCDHLFHACTRLEPHACSRACPRPRADLRRLFVPSRRASTHPCERCMREQMDYPGDDYYVGYYSQCLLHQLALGVPRTIFIRPSNTFRILEDFGLTTESSVDEFRACIAEYLAGRRPRLDSSRFRVYVVETPDNYVEAQYRRRIAQPEFAYVREGGIAGRFLRLCEQGESSEK